MLLETYLAFVLASFVLIVLPGPTNMVVVASAIRFGFSSSLWTILGAALSHILFFMIASFGLAAILMTSAQLFFVLKWAGVCYLIWLGLVQLISRQSTTEFLPRQPMASARSLLIRGITVNSTNPKALVFYSTFFPPFLNPNLNIGWQLLIMGVTFVAIFVGVVSLHAWSVARLGGLFNRGLKMKLVNRFSGVVLIGAGLLLATVNRE